MTVKFWIKMSFNFVLFVLFMMMVRNIFASYPQMNTDMMYALLVTALALGGYLIIQALWWKDKAEKKKMDHELRNLQQIAQGIDIMRKSYTVKADYVREASRLVATVKAYYDCSYGSHEFEKDDSGKIVDPEYYVWQDLKVIQLLLQKTGLTDSGTTKH